MHPKDGFLLKGAISFFEEDNRMKKENKDRMIKGAITNIEFYADNSSICEIGSMIGAVEEFILRVIESISDEGWNDDTINLGKRASVDIHGINDPVFDKSGKKPRNDDEGCDEDALPNLKVGETSSQGKDYLKNTEAFMESPKKISDDAMRLEDLSDEKVDFDPNEDDLPGTIGVNTQLLCMIWINEAYEWA
ncbi:hypothetical protein ACJX0J_040162, partial [Zea mays]